MHALAGYHVDVAVELMMTCCTMLTWGLAFGATGQVYDKLLLIMSDLHNMPAHLTHLTVQNRNWSVMTLSSACMFGLHG